MGDLRGAPYLIHALHEPEQPLVWVELEPRDRGDLVLQGDKLAPYRIAVDSWADFAELEQRLASGWVAEALELYRGPLLATSDATLIAEARELLEESLRRAVLDSKVEALWTLAERLKDDLEL